MNKAAQVLDWIEAKLWREIVVFVLLVALLALGLGGATTMIGFLFVAADRTISELGSPTDRDWVPIIAQFALAGLVVAILGLFQRAA